MRKYALLIILVPMLLLALAASASAQMLMGRQTAATTAATETAGAAEAFQYTATASGASNDIELYVNKGTTATSVQVGLYSDATGEPGSLLASGTLTKPQATGWNDVTVQGVSLSKGQNYWIAILPLGGALGYFDTAGGTAPAYAESNQNLSSLPQTYAAGTESNVSPVRAYVNGVPSGLQMLVGQQTMATTADSASAGVAKAFQYTATTSGASHDVEIFANRGSTAKSLQVGLYSDTNGTPGTLLASGSVSSMQPGGWTDVPIAGATLTRGQSYWIAPLPTGGTMSYLDTPGGTGNSVAESANNLSSLPQTYSAGAESQASPLTAFVNGTATGGTGNPPPVNGAAPVMSGTAQAGDTLTANAGAWSGSPTSYAYQSQDCNSSGGSCANISGATGSSYKLVAGDVGHTVVVVVTAMNEGGSGTASSSATSVVQAAPSAPVITSAPVISGTAQVGDTLAANAGAWSGSPTSYAYLWQDCNSSGGSCANIAGATHATYALQSTDVGDTIVVVVTASNSAGSGSAASDATAVVTNGSASGPPSNTGAPQLTGTAREGVALASSTGTWTGSPTPTFTYQWYDCDAVGNNCSTITGATNASYSPQATDLGYSEYVAVTATNGSGTVTVSTDSSPAIGVPSWTPSTDANIWVNTSAGSCTRSALPAAYNSSTACGKLSAAYAIASCGDVIEIQPGTYNEQDTLRNRTALDSCTTPVFFKGAAGARPAFSNIDSEYTGAGASNFIIQHIDLSVAASGCVSAGSNTDCDTINLAGGHNVVIDDVTNGNVSLFGEAHVLVEDSRFGPCYGSFSSFPGGTGGCTNNTKIDSGTGSVATNDVTFRNNTFTHFVDGGVGGGDFETMFARGGTDVMIDSNHFNNCELHCIFMQPTSRSMAGTTIQNNWFDETENSVVTPPYYDTSYSAKDANINSVEFGANTSGEQANLSGVTIRYNSFGPYTGVSDTGSTPAGPNYIYGNVGGINTCVPNTTEAYNIWVNGQSTCSVASNTTVASLPFLNSTYGVEDFHLTCSSTAAGFVTSSAYQTVGYDIDGNARPPGAATAGGRRITLAAAGRQSHCS